MFEMSLNNPILTFISLVLWILIINLCKSASKPPYIISTSKRRLRSLLILCFVVFEFWGGDFYHTLEAYPYMHNGEPFHYEEIYIWIAQYLSTNYYEFRLVIWGMSLVLLALTFKQLTLKNDLQWYIFSVFGLIWLSYARVSLGMSLMFYGLTIIIRPYKYKNTSIILGLVLIFLSSYFHKSCYFGIIIILIAICLQKISNKTFILILFLIMLSLSAVQSVLGNIMNLDSGNFDGGLAQTVTSAQSYMNQDIKTDGYGVLLLQGLERSAYLILAFLCIKTLLNKKINIPSVYSTFIKVYLLIILTFIAFSINWGVNTTEIADRFLKFAFIPGTIIISFFWKTEIYPKMLKITLYLSLTSSFAYLLYAYYCSLSA